MNGKEEREYEERIRQSLQKLKAFEINRIRKIERQMQEFMEEMRKVKTKDDFLTSNEVKELLGISDSSFRRMLKNGLKYSQKERKGKILVKRKDLENYLKND